MLDIIESADDYSIVSVDVDGSIKFRVIWYDAGGSDAGHLDFRTLQQARNHIKEEYEHV